MSRNRIMGQPVPSSPADQSARQLDHTLRQLLLAIGEQTTIARASLPQFYCVSDLMQRWSCSHDAVIHHLATYCGYVGARGVKPTVSLDDVLRIDRALVDQYEARKRVLALRSRPVGQEVAHAS